MGAGKMARSNCFPKIKLGLVSGSSRYLRVGGSYLTEATAPRNALILLLLGLVIR